MLAAPAAPWRERCRNATVFAGLVLAMVAPYLVYVQLSGGLWSYFATALEQNRSEPGYVWPSPFAAGAPPESRLLYLFHLLPVVAMGVCAMDWRSRRDRWETLLVTSVACTAVAVNFGLIRDALEVRVRDVVVPAAVLGAWLAYRAWVARPRYLLIPAAVTVLGAGLAIGELGDGLRGTVNRAGLTGQIWSRPGSLLVHFAERSATLRDALTADPPSRTVPVLHPFLAYLDRCTTEQHHLFLGGFIPEVAYLARRPFAGGAYEDYNFSSPVDQRRVVDRLRRQLVPFALIPSGSASDLEELTIVAGHFRGRYVLLADLLVAGDDRISILLDGSLPSMSRDAETGWPCFK